MHQEGIGPRGHRQIGTIWFYLALAVFAGAAATLLLFAVLPGVGIADMRRIALPVVFFVLLAGLAAMRGWWHDRKAAAELSGAEDAVRRQMEGALQEKQTAIERERSLRHRVETARRSEREWNRELRTQIVRMHRERGELSDWHDVRALILHITITLLEAEKGMLLARADSDGDGKLDLVCAEGFESPPEDSQVAQRFAEEVIERDRTVRESDGGEIDSERRAPADDEIRNLVAIPIYISDDFHGVVVCANNTTAFEDFEDDVLLALGDHAGATLENMRLHGALRSSYLSTIRMLSEAIEAKDPFLRGHSEEVSSYVAAVAERLELPPKRREEVVFGSLLHDVGKIGISERILLKPAGLTPEERSIVQLHPRIGYRLVQQVPSLRSIAAAILYHHERYDGSGYPSRLRGEEIPLEARIICVADSFSAMTAERPYRRRMSMDEACEELERCAGTQFDPEIVRIFCEEVRNNPATADKLSDLAGALADPELQERRTGEEPLLGYGSLAVTDNLTLLYCHRYFHEVAQAQAERARLQKTPFGVLFVELTDIAEINRHEGYVAGDEVIKRAARAMQRAAVRCGGTAARYSGRRLALVAPEADAERAERIAAEIAADLDGGPAVRIASAAWREGEGGEDVIARARLALQPSGIV